MFYRKTDAEVFCETLLKLVEKQEKFIERHLGKAKRESPYAESINVILTQIEHKFGLPSGKIKKASETHERLIDTPSLHAPEIQKVEKKKRGRPPKQRFFNNSKPPIQVVHGHSDDIAPHYHTEEVKETPEIGASVKQVEAQKINSMPLKSVTTPPSITPDNIDKFAANMVENLDSQNEVLPQ